MQVIVYSIMYIIGAFVCYEWHAGTLQIENPLFSIIALLCLGAFLLLSVAILGIIIAGIFIGIFKLLQLIWKKLKNKQKVRGISPEPLV